MPIPSKETFEKASPEVQRCILYDFCQVIYEKVENRKRTDKAFSLAGGFFGGIAAVLMKGLFWK